MDKDEFIARLKLLGFTSYLTSDTHAYSKIINKELVPRVLYVTFYNPYLHKTLYDQVAIATPIIGDLRLKRNHPLEHGYKVFILYEDALNHLFLYLNGDLV